MCSTTVVRTGVRSWSAISRANTGNTLSARTTRGVFSLDGSVRAIPLAKGYEGTRMTKENPDCNVRRPREWIAIAGSFLPASRRKDHR